MAIGFPGILGTAYHYVVRLILAVGVVVYTGFLFGQAEGRDLWQSTLLPVHLLVQGLMAGSAALLVIGLFIDFTSGLRDVVLITFTGA